MAETEYEELDGARYDERQLPVNIRVSYGEVYNVEIQTTILANLNDPKSFIHKIQEVEDLLTRAIPKAQIKGETSEEELGIDRDGKITKGPKGISESLSSLEKLKSDMPARGSDDGQ